MNTSAPTTRIPVSTVPPPTSAAAATTEPLPKKPKQQRFLNVAVAGCSHGEMDKIYSTLKSMEQSSRMKFDLLICCGDYQAIRNLADLHTMHVKPNFRCLGTFHQYYSGQKIAPIFTIFVGGNHESSGFLAELPNGGWVAPNIFYMGYSNVVKFAGLTIGGLSGIYKSQDYNKGHFERPPFDYGSTISAYHVRSMDIFRLKQLARRNDEPRPNCLDIIITHDWPVGITDFGDTRALLRYKPYFEDDIRNGVLGNPETMEVLRMLKPRYWFSAHLHCRYEAQVYHDHQEDINQLPEETKFLALGKPAKNQRFVEAVQIPIAEDAKLTFEYDPLWCAVLRNTDHLLQLTSRNIYMPSSSGTEQWDFRPTQEQIQMVHQLFGNNFEIPHNFQLTAPPHRLTDSPLEPCLYYQNPQSTEFCEKLQITNFNKLLYEKTKDCQGIPYFQRLNNATAAGGAEEIDLGDLDDEAAVDEFGDDFFVVDGDDVEETETPHACDCEDEEIVVEKEVQVSTITREEDGTVIVEKQTTTVVTEEAYVPPPLSTRVTVADRILKRRRVDIPEEEGEEA
uniref:Lariat debranching enzyme C-terminal domain-containing protein n=1 Tax=Panagrolaimus sp. ES5 TaxID=591445 RepID=A0AC34F6V8_9BILA